MEIERFLAWDDDLKARIRKAAYRYCERFCEFVGKEPPRGCTVGLTNPFWRTRER